MSRDSFGHARGIENYNHQIDIDIANPLQLTRIRVAKQDIPTSKKYFHDGAQAQRAFVSFMFFTQNVIARSASI